MAEGFPTYTTDSDDVIEAEKSALNIKGKSVGLAISGGGIRSASFGLGIMQGLAVNGIMKKISYLSTVSGGGFIGSALTWALHRNRKADLKDNFPLGKKKHLGKNRKNHLLNYLRQHGNYLMPHSAMDAISFAAVVLRGILVSLFVYGGVITAVMILLNNSGILGIHDQSIIAYFWPTREPLITEIKNLAPAFFSQNISLFLSFWLLVLIGAMNLIYALRLRHELDKLFSRYKGFLFGQKLLGTIWKLFFFFLAVGSIPLIAALIRTVSGESSISFSGIATTLGTITGIWQYIKAQSNDSSSGIFGDIVLYCGASLMLIGLLIGSYSISKDIRIIDMANWGYRDYLILVLVVLSFITGFAANINLIGPHRIWRNRLMETFMPSENAVKNNQWEGSFDADKANVKDMRKNNRKGPYHIVNTNAILVDSNQTRYRNRGGDNFIITPLYCGSDATGYASNKVFQKDRKGITLATAMAASGAALNPNAGVSGGGITRNKIISMLLSILNLGLGYWATNPKLYEKKECEKEHGKGKNNTPHFLSPGLLGMMGKMLNEDHADIQLSDGGHFENCGLYELVRRKLDVILLCDSGADPNYTFEDLGNAIEKIRVDFGVKVKFKTDGRGIEDLMPGTYHREESYNEKGKDPYGRAKSCFAIGDITYADNSKGKLVLFKPTMIYPLATDVYSYKELHPSFPQQTTADQFYDEKQFEAYRELGYSVAWNFVKNNPIKFT